MSRPTKSVQLLEKSIHAAISAIEIYNKPDFKYREESFCILMSNAWEILLKAKLLEENNNDVRVICVKEPVIKKDGSRGKRKVYKTNRCGNAITIDLFKAIQVLNSKYNAGISDKCITNLELLVEVRDNAIHFYNTDPGFAKKVLEIGTATLRSYITYAQQWFDCDLSKYNFYLMPVSFFHSFEIESFSVNKREKQVGKLLNYITQQEGKFESDESDPHNVTLRFETRFVKSKKADAAEVRYTNNPNAPAVRVKEEDVIRSKYPLYYKSLSHQLRDRYTDFKVNSKYHKIRKSVIDNKKYCHTRLLNPKNPKSSKTVFYSTEIFKLFDQHYNKKS